MLALCIGARIAVIRGPLIDVASSQ